MSIRYTHTNIISKDWQKLVKFYQDVFNCKRVPPERDFTGDWLSKCTGVKNASLKGIHLRLPGHGDDGPTLEILQYDEIAEKPTPKSNREGYGHIAFHVDDVDLIYEKALIHGGKQLGEVVKKEIEGVGLLTLVYMTDPEGNIIEIQNWGN
ncbi:MAG: VOC family protein [Desulfobacterales bacterium]|nr:VOC family protein [Desulfobacterales bacterium]MCP4159089.1 VOC family protein [Deltaproteobacteria bacterium]